MYPTALPAAAVAGYATAQSAQQASSYRSLARSPDLFPFLSLPLSYSLGSCTEKTHLSVFVFFSPALLLFSTSCTYKSSKKVKTHQKNRKNMHRKTRASACLRVYCCRMVFNERVSTSLFLSRYLQRVAVTIDRRCLADPARDAHTNVWERRVITIFFVRLNLHKFCVRFWASCVEGAI